MISSSVTERSDPEFTATVGIPTTCTKFACQTSSCWTATSTEEPPRCFSFPSSPTRTSQGWFLRLARARSLVRPRCPVRPPVNPVGRSCRRWHAVLRGRHLWRMQVQGRGNEAGCQPRRATQHTRTKQTLPSPLLGAPRRRRSDRSLRRRHVRSRQRHPPLFGRRRARALTGQGVRLTVPHVSCAKEPSEYLQEGTRREI